MHHIIPVGIMMDIITGVAIGIIPTFLVVITGAPAILGIIGKIYPDNDESQVRCPCSKNKGLDKVRSDEPKKGSNTISPLCSDYLLFGHSLNYSFSIRLQI